MNPAQTQGEIVRLAALLEARTDQYRTDAQAAAEAEAEFKSAYYRAVLGIEAKVTEEQRKAIGHNSAKAEFVRSVIAKGTAEATLESVRSLRAQLSALQSLLSFEREMAR